MTHQLKEPETWRAAAAEFLGVFTLVFIAVGTTGIAIGLDSGPHDAAGLLLMGLANGIAVAVAVAAFARISGAHVNPAVTLAALITGNIDLPRALIYLLFQLAGAAAATALTHLIFQIPNLGVHNLNPALSAPAGFGLEAILTFLLVIVVFATAIDKRANQILAPLAIGAIVAIDSFAGLPLTGASMNPARSFGPALIHLSWEHHWLYWAAPITGALAAATTYTLLFGTPQMRQRLRLRLSPPWSPTPSPHDD